VFDQLASLHTVRCPFSDLPTSKPSRWGGLKGVPSVRHLPSLYIRQECAVHSSKQPT
jgi:hypothetical protein